MFKKKSHVLIHERLTSLFFLHRNALVRAIFTETASVLETYLCGTPLTISLTDSIDRRKQFCTPPKKKKNQMIRALKNALKFPKQFVDFVVNFSRCSFYSEWIMHGLPDIGRCEIWCWSKSSSFGLGKRSELSRVPFESVVMCWWIWRLPLWHFRVNAERLIQSTVALKHLIEKSSDCRHRFNQWGCLTEIQTVSGKWTIVTISWLISFFSMRCHKGSE